MRVYRIFFVSALLFSFSCYSQSKPLSVGDTLPAELFSIITNQKPQTENKVYILDFFATFCTSCIRELPKLDSLKQQFNNSLDIIIMACESAEKMAALRKKNKTFAACRLPVISADSVFKNLFPHLFLPHEVWITERGKILAITDQYAITAENIRAFLNGKQPTLAVKADAIDFDRKIPLLQNNNGGTGDNLLFQTKFTTYLPGIASSTGIHHTGNGTRWYIINFPILNLYREALEFTPNRVIVECRDSSRYFLPAEPDLEWKVKNLYTWEFTGPADFSKKQMQPFLLQDLGRWLGLHGRMEKRKVKCYVITRISNADTLLKTKQEKPALQFPDDGNIIFINQPFAKFIAGLNTARTSVPGSPVFTDETGIDFNVDLSFPKTAKQDIGLLRKTLSSYNMKLTLAEREIDMFILSEKNKTTEQ